MVCVGGKLLYHPNNSGGKGVGLLYIWDLDTTCRVTSGVGAATWGIMFLSQLWWHALRDMGHIMGGKWY